MPDPKNNAKLTGDTHLPDAESADLPIEPSTIESAARTRARADEFRPSRGTRKAGELVDHDPAEDADGPSADAGDGGGDGGGGGGDGGGSGD